MSHASERQAAVVTIAGAPEVDHAIARLVLAFSTDPVARSMYDDPHQYLLHIPRLFRALGTSSFSAGAAQRTSDGLGIAIWLTPGVHGDDRPLETVIADSIAAEKQAEVGASSRGPNTTGQSSPIGTCRSLASKPCIGTKGAGRKPALFELVRAF
jgi:hypothetical protein